MRTTLALLAAVMLFGCAPKTSSPMLDGPGTAPPPPGWVDYCGRHPEDPSC